MDIISTKDKVKTKEEYLKENCEICNGRFSCSIFDKVSLGKISLSEKCNSFDDVFA